MVLLLSMFLSKHLLLSVQSWGCKELKHGQLNWIHKGVNFQETGGQCREECLPGCIPHPEDSSKATFSKPIPLRQSVSSLRMGGRQSGVQAPFLSWVTGLPCSLGRRLLRETVCFRGVSEWAGTRCSLIQRLTPSSGYSRSTFSSFKSPVIYSPIAACRGA